MVPSVPGCPGAELRLSCGGVGAQVGRTLLDLRGRLLQVPEALHIVLAKD